METLAIVFVFVSNGTMMVGLIWVLFYLSRAADRIAKQMADASADLVAAGRGLRGLGDGVDRLIERLGTAERQAAAASQSIRESALDAAPQIDAAMRSHGERLAQDLSRRMTAGDEALLASLAQMLGTRNDAADAERALAADVRAEALRAERDQQAQQELMLARVRASDADALLEAVRQDLQAGSEDSARRLAEAAAAHEALQRELDDARLTSQKLQQSLSTLQASMHRTLLEKDFIEQKFMDLDTQADKSTASAA